jgi:predicted O-methyltransferase YrrM
MAPSFLKRLPVPPPLKRFVTELVVADRERRGSEFADVSSWPDEIRGFEDLSFLFTSTILAHGIASLRLDEAVYLYRLVRDEQPTTVVEIGRYRGGSTFVMASALERGTLHSYDIPVRQGHPGSELDRQLTAALERYGLAHRVRLHVGDSRTAEPPTGDIDILFIDGDHTEAGVRADVERWSGLVRRGGHMLLHDAVAAPDFAPPAAEGPMRVASEITGGFERGTGAGSLAHFFRRG